MTTKSAREAAIEAALAEPPRFHAGAPRLAAPNADLSSDTLGHLVELIADGFGIVRPADVDAVRLADSLGLTVLRSPDQEASGEPEPAGDPLAGLTKAQLLALAAERGIEVDPKATNAAIRDALAEDTAEPAE